ncbi:MAG TPA: diacylglycerol kinase family lipid kinase [Polyangiaceae bacterium]|nr:diacylglycerol kinase family lipid kinase [Polyangiaceae bacterium]
MSGTVVIVNPKAAAGRVGRDLSGLRRAVEARLGAVELVETTAPGGGSTLAREAALGGAARVLSLGGDGTHHEVVNGLMESGRPDVVFGVLPVGTGGDFRRTLGVRDLDGALAAIVERPARRVDLGHATFVDDAGVERSRWFLNLASCGMSGLVDRLVNTSSKALGGTASFLLGTLRATARYEPARARVEVDGALLGELDVTVIAVGNGRYAGGGMHFCPEAALDDGALDVVVVPHASLPRQLARIPDLYRGTLERVPGALRARGAEVRVTCLRGTAWLDLDGEAPGRAPVTFRVEPKALALAGAPPTA